MPWNKGKTLSLETRLRMSLAKQRSLRPKATKRKVSLTHLRMGHTPMSAVPPRPLNPGMLLLTRAPLHQAEHLATPPPPPQIQPCHKSPSSLHRFTSSRMQPLRNP